MPLPVFGRQPARAARENSQPKNDRRRDQRRTAEGHQRGERTIQERASPRGISYAKPFGYPASHPVGQKYTAADKGDENRFRGEAAAGPRERFSYPASMW